MSGVHQLSMVSKRQGNTSRTFCYGWISKISTVNDVQTNEKTTFVVGSKIVAAREKGRLANIEGASLT